MHFTRWNRRALVAVAIVVLALVTAACGGGGDKETEKTTTTVKRTTTTVPPPAAPLTGVPQPDAGKLSRPALIVKVDNTPKGMAVQEGLDKADLVFVEQTEQGTTRLAVVFQSHDATVGPVRSARTSDVHIASTLNRPMLAYSGANGGVLRQVRAAPLVDVGIDARGVTSIYTRNQRGGTRNLYRYFIPTADMYAARGTEGGTPPSMFRYRPKGVPTLGEPVKGVQVGYGGGAATIVSYEWNGDGWDRTQNGRAHVMARGGPRLSPANIVVLTVPYRSSGFRDVTGAMSPEAVLEGSGDAWFFAGGKVVRGRWVRTGPNAPFTFSAPDGTVPVLTPGQTFIELAPGPGSATIIPNPPPSTTTTTTAAKTTTSQRK
jgi:hypothetical protein